MQTQWLSSQVLKKKPQHILTCTLLGSAAILLAGCWKSISPFSQHPDYTIEYQDNDKPSFKTYMEVILADRLKTDIDEQEGSEDFTRAENYRESSIRSDLFNAAKSLGYYDALVSYDDGNVPLTGKYKIDSGAAYKITNISIKANGLEEGITIDMIKIGEPLIAHKVIAAQNSIYNNIQKNSCYFNTDVKHGIILDKLEKSAQVTFYINAENTTTFGNTTFTGNESVATSYLQNRIPWRDGDCFNREKIEKLKAKLLDTGLFSRADSDLPTALSPDGAVPISMILQESAHRSIKAGASFYSDEGIGIILGWSHNNFFGQAEKLEAELIANQLTQDISLDFTKPYFIRDDQSFKINTSFGREDTDAYEEVGIDIGAGINRHITKYLQGSTALSFTYSEITDQDDTNTYALTSLPVSLSYDSRDDSLDAHKGILANAKIEPVFDMLGTTNPYARFETELRHYMPLTKSEDPLLALRSNVSSIIGPSTEDLPATERFYAGGGGSVRGFGHQEIGPFEDGDPLGGRSAITGSVELRMKITDALGGVAFLDAGSVSEKTVPDLDNLSFGAGLGFRYFTGFGPLRFDVALPLNKKENLDQNYQIYISIGQAF